MLKHIDLSTVTHLLNHYWITRIQRLPDSEKQRLREWVKQVREVRSADMSPSERTKRLEDLHTPELIIDVVKAELASFAASTPFTHHHQDKARTLLDIAQNMVKTGPFSLTTLLGFGLNKLLPRLMLSAEAEVFLNGLSNTLDEAPPSPS